ncbi:MAG: hypothetical protein H8E37_12580 [Planctomycetes bacterium]|nr:hypothetical protein [Planctomycetota bacterium]
MTRPQSAAGDLSGWQLGGICVGIRKSGTVFLMRTLREARERPLFTIGGLVGMAERLPGQRLKRQEVVISAAVLQKMRAPARAVAGDCR